MITDGQSDRLAGDSRAELADACRAIIEELASSTASSAAFVQATAMVQQAVSLLAGAAHGRPYEEAEGSLANYQEHIFIDHSPIVGPLNPLAPFREWRAAVARASGQPDTAVCTDRVLRSLAESPPASPAELAQRLGITETAAVRLRPLPV